MLNKEERETSINFNSADKTASIYTSQPEVWQRLEKLDGFKPLEENKMDGKVVSKEFEFSKSFIRFGKRGLIIAPPKKEKPMSETQREALRQRLLRSKSPSGIGTSETSEPVRHAKPRQEAKKC